MNTLAISSIVASGRVEIANTRRLALTMAKARIVLVGGLFILIAVIAVFRVLYLGLFEGTPASVSPFGLVPQRGDIVTIDSSAAHELIVKRLIGLPGDSVAMRDNVLYVNGVRADYQPLKLKPLPGDTASRGDYLTERFDGVVHTVRLAPDAPSPRSSFGPVIVPQGEYLMLGDNRDDSADSRYFGFFPRKELMGRTRHVAFSLDPDHYYKPRFERFGAPLDAASLTASR